MAWLGTRARLLRFAASGVATLFVPRAQRTPLLAGLRAGNSGLRPYARDDEELTTVSPAPGRRSARLRFRLLRRAHVSLQVLRTGQGVASERPVSSGESSLSTRAVTLGPGPHTIGWTPPADLPPRTYVLELSAQAAGDRPVTARSVVRVLGVDAGFLVRSAQPGDTATLVIRTDAASLDVQILRSGPEADPTYADDEIKGVPVTDPVTLDWTRHGDGPSSIGVQVGDWTPGVYAARLQADDGRVGFAPLVVRPALPTRRIAVVMPATTWQAYNFYDFDGDGWGDTWYARWRTRDVLLSRPHARRGVPFRYRSYDLAFQRWLVRTEKEVDVYADEDLERFTPATLRTAYDLVVFPGHSEYVTATTYDVVSGYRDLGGNLLFLSANNFFRRVDRAGQTITLVDEWRNLGRPEAALCGVQYVASDRGERHAPFTVVGADAAPWAFAGTGLQNGSQFGVYGIEIDARAPSSPPGTTVLATIPDLFGPGRSAEMAYYEHASGAKVFSAGVLNFGGQVSLWPQTTQLLENVWARLAPATT
ncbi:MAG TPA: N,N-dimethylformamidase beta subunit family domain-containing protein [Gaiellaceae bacterium]|nr:N,N-dimethylformamidase beta subunit family domain-containing protein [Gaiellaceae bacterium]